MLVSMLEPRTLDGDAPPRTDPPRTDDPVPDSLLPDLSGSDPSAPDSPSQPAEHASDQAGSLRSTAVRYEQQVHPAGVLPALQSLLYLLVVAMFLMTFTAQPIRIPSPSMEPTLLVGDFLLLDKQSVAGSAGGLLAPAAIRRGDVIVFHDPVGDPSIHLVKRVVALPGDRLHLRDGVLFLNGVRQDESYAVHHGTAEDPFRDDFPTLLSTDPGVDPAWWISLRSQIHDGELSVPEGHYFVMGDNRDNSEDSRYWGFVPAAAVVGKPLLIYFSWKQPITDSPGQRSAEEDEQADNRRVTEEAGHSRSRFGLHAGDLDFARWDRTFRVVR